MAYIKISDRVFDKTITLRNAFEILTRFVEQYHARGESSTGALLVDLSLGSDGTPLDPAQIYDFLLVAADVLQDDVLREVARNTLT